MKCSELIDNVIQKGGTILSNKTEGTNGFQAKKVDMRLNDCDLKIAYMDFGKEIMVEQLCSCQNKECINKNKWGLIPESCIENMQ